jgi:hypothetical protein
VKTASGWGHLQDAKAAVAWAVEGFGRENGTWTVTLDGKGQTSFRFAPSEPTPVHRLTVYEHAGGDRRRHQSDGHAESARRHGRVTRTKGGLA